MPPAKISESRRSARLKNAQCVLSQLEPETRKRSRTKRARNGTGSQLINEIPILDETNRSAQLSQSIASNVDIQLDLCGLEKKLRSQERELGLRERELDARNLDFEKTQKKREADAILEQLNENYTCTLCLEVLAFPCVLSSPKCGHSFCGLCIIRWFFSRLCGSCESWHEEVQCPVCRASLTHTPKGTVRPMNTFPFSPNRLADNHLKTMIERLSQLCNALGLVTNSKKGKGRASTRGARKTRVKNEQSTYLESDETTLQTWAEGGQSKKDWLQRYKISRTEADDLVEVWGLLSDNDFVKIKERLKL